MNGSLIPRLLLAWASVGAACAPSSGRPDRAELPTVRIGVNREVLSTAPLYLAQAEGYFAEQGVRVEILPVPEGTSQVLPALMQGRLDATASGLNLGLFNAIARGAPVRIVAAKGHIARDGCASIALIARRELIESGELADLRRLRGRKVSVNPKSSGAFGLEVLLAPVGLSLDDIKTVTIPDAAEIEALNRGAIDAAGAEEPWVTHLTSAGHGVLRLYPPRDFAVILFGPTLLEENPDAGRRFMVAYLRGVHLYNQGKTARNLENLSRATGIDLETMKRLCWPSVRRNGWVDAQSIVDLQRWGMRRGLLTRAVTPEQFWDPSFVEHANRALSTAAR